MLQLIWPVFVSWCWLDINIGSESGFSLQAQVDKFHMHMDTLLISLELFASSEHIISLRPVCCFLLNFWSLKKPNISITPKRWCSIRP